MKPRLLDLFAGAQGAAVGYARAGFEVHAVDIEEHERHPEVETFTTADAFEVLADVEFCRTFDIVHASPPCQRYSTATPLATKTDHPDWIAPVRTLLRVIGRPYVLENVEGARRELDHPIRLCGSSFGLGVQRHRYFETSPTLLFAPQCYHADRPWTVTGDHPDAREYLRPSGTRRARKPLTLAHAREVMGIDWMEWDDLADAIPPAYTRWLGEQLMAALDLAPDDAATVAPALKEARS